MAYPTVLDRKETSTGASTTINIDFYSSTAAGDLVIAFIALNDTAQTITTTESFTNWTNTSATFHVIYKVLTGTEGSSTTVTVGTSTKSAVIAYTIQKDTFSQTAVNPYISTVATGATGNPDSGSLSPSPGSSEYLWISAFRQNGEEADDDTWVTSAPTTPGTFTGLIQKTTATSGLPNTNGSLGSAEYQATTATVDPGAFTVAQSIPWRAYTVAVLGKRAGSFTLDAVIKKNQPGSFTLDAVIKKTFPKSFTLDAEKFIASTTVPGSFTADAVIHKLWGKTLTLDAILRKSLDGTPFTLDAILLRSSGTKTFTADAVILKTREYSGFITTYGQDDFSGADGPLAGSTADVGGTWAVSPTTWALTGRVVSGTVSATSGSNPDDVTYRLGSGTIADATALIKISADRSVGVTLRDVSQSDLRLYQSKAYPVGGFWYVEISRRYGGVFTYLEGDSGMTTVPSSSDIWLRFKVSGSSPNVVQARIWPVGESEPGTWQVDKTNDYADLAGAGGYGLYLKWNATGAPIGDDFLVTSLGPLGGAGPGFTADALIGSGVTTVPGSLTADAVLIKSSAKTFTANAVIKASSGTKTFTADAVFKKTISARDVVSPLGAGAAYYVFGSSDYAQYAQSAQFAASGPVALEIWLLKTGSPSDNIIVEVQTDDSDKPSGTVVAVLGSVVGSTLTDKLVTFGPAGSLQAGTKYWFVIRRDGALSNTDKYNVLGWQGDTYAGQKSGAGGPGNWTALSTWDLVFTASITGFSADAVIKASSGTKTFTLDAVLLKGSGTQSFTADAVLLASSGTKTFTLDAELARVTLGNFVLDAVVLRGQTGTPFTLDAVIHAPSGTKTFTLDAVRHAPSGTKTFTVDALIVVVIWADSFDRYSDHSYGSPDIGNVAYDRVHITPANVWAGTDGNWRLEAVTGSAQARAFGVRGIQAGSIQFDMLLGSSHADGDYARVKAGWVYASIYWDSEGGGWGFSSGTAGLFDTSGISGWWRIKVWGDPTATRVKRWPVGEPEPDAWENEGDPYVFFSPGALEMGATEDLTRVADNLVVLMAEGPAWTMGEFRLDALIRKTQSKTVTLDAVLLKGSGTKAFTLDAVLLASSGTKTLTLDAVLLASSGTKTFTLDAELAQVTLGNFVLDAVVLRGQTGTPFTLDAVVLRSSGTKTFTLNAIIKVTIGGTGATARPNVVASDGGWKAAGSTTVTVPTPSGTVAGDWLLAWVTTDGLGQGSSGVWADQGGWATLAYTQSNSYDIVRRLVMRRYESGDPSSWTFQTPSGADATGLMLTIRGSIIPSWVSNTGAGNLSTFHTTNELSVRTHPDPLLIAGFDVAEASTLDQLTWRAGQGHHTFFDIGYGQSGVELSFRPNTGAPPDPTNSTVTEHAYADTSTSRSTGGRIIVLYPDGVWITADAVLRATVPGSFTADAVLLKSSGTKTFSLDAVIKRTQASSFPVDAIVTRTVSAGLTADAVKRATIPGSFTVSAISKRTAAGTFLVDAVLDHVETGQLSLDAVISAHSGTKAFTLDAWLQRTVTSDISADAVLLREMLGTGFTLDAWIPGVGLAAFTVDAVTRRDMAGTPFVLDAVINKSSGTKSFAADALLLWTAPGQVAADAVVLAHLDRTLEADAVIRATSTKTFTLDAVVRTTIGGSWTVDAAIQASTLGFLTTDAVVLAHEAGSLTLDAIIRGSASGNLFLDAVVLRDQLGSFALNAVLVGAASSSFTVNAVLVGTRAGSFTVAAVITRGMAGSFVLDGLLLATSTGSFPSDAILLTLVTKGFTADAWIPGTGVGGFTIEAILAKAGSGSFTANAVVRRTASGSYTVDAVLLRNHPASLTTDAIVLASRTRTFSVDAEIASGTKTGAFPVQAIVTRTASGTVSVDAVLRRTSTSSFTLDAIQLKTAELAGFAADAVIEATRMGGFATNAVLLSPQGSTFSVDARLVGGFTLDAYIVGRYFFTLDANISRRIVQEIEATFSARTIAATFSATTIEGTTTAKTIAATWYTTWRLPTRFTLDAEIA